MPNLPTGTITFLFTDIQGSAKLWEQFPDEMRDALARHDAIMQQAIEGHGGCVFKTMGDGFCAAFHTPPEALAAALAAQRALHAEAWGEMSALRVRMALHTGTADLRDGDYFGQPLNRVSRLLSAGHGGQTLLSLATQELMRDQLPPGIELKDLGERRLRDLIRPERIFQLVAPDLPSEFAPLRSLEAFAHNLPMQLTSFVGREKEIAEIKAMLASHRLVTLTGTGGTGKTRLSVQVAADLLEDFLDGVWFVELASLADPNLVPQTVATVLGVREEPARPIIQTLSDYLKSRNVLILLDNCEHLLTACAQLCETLLRVCSRVRILASSREGVGIAGEQTFRVPSLTVPDPKEWGEGRRQKAEGSQDSSLIPHLSSLTQYESVRLFIDRALLVQPTFAVTNQNAPALAQICHRLDGIPLAIELAAARVKAMSVEQINTRIHDRFRLLTGGSRTALPRQQTLRALIDWSYDLLSDKEKTLLRRLSVFAGGWTLEAAEKVCSDVPS
jgi:predicted ATPase/class 3 adenylate cyclase